MENFTTHWVAIATPALLLGVVVDVWIFRFLRRRRNQVSFRHLRGRSLRTAQQVQEALADTAPNQGLRLGQYLLPQRAAYGHFAIVGATGSGKTLLLGGLGLRCPIATFHPLDARCVAWDMAADITSPAAALQAATLLVPKAQQDANPFFSNAARHLMSAALLALILQAPGRWTLRHLLLVLRSESLLRQVLAQTEFTRPLLQYGEHPATFQNILSTLLTRIAPFEIIAAAWDRAEHKLSLRAALEQEAILILANDEDNRAAIDTIKQWLFKRLSELVLAREGRPEDSPRATWLFLDEVRQAARLDGLSALITKGRSKGAVVLLGFQGIEVYGREAANELVGQRNVTGRL